MKILTGMWIFLLCLFFSAPAEAWSPADALQPKPSIYSLFAEKMEAPSLSGGRAAAAEWGNPAVAAGPEQPFDGTISFVDFSLFGGYAWGNIFGGSRISAGAAFSDGKGIVPFVAGDLALEYVRSEGSGSLLKTGALAFGLAGAAPFPWAIVGRAHIGDAAPVPRAEFALQAAAPTWELFSRYRLRIAGGAGIAVQDVYADMELFARASAMLEGRDYIGGLAQGMAASLFNETGWGFGDTELSNRLRLGVAGALRFGNFAGLAGKLTFSVGNRISREWTSALRARGSTAAIASFIGLFTEIEAPVLFARGRLFLSSRLPVEFFLKPYAEFLFTAPSGGAMFAREGIYGGMGFEIAMVLDAERRDAFRFGAGMDFSEWMQGLTILDFGDMALFFAFSLVF